MSRHPYTFAADFIRHHAGYNEEGTGTLLSRAQAGQIRKAIAAVLGITDEELAIKLSEAYQRNMDAYVQADVEALSKAMGRY